MTEPLANDPRWQKFNDKGFRCSCCGRTFGGIFDIAYHAPGPWPHGPVGDRIGSIWRVDNDFVGPDLCRVADHYFVRGVVEIPVTGTESRFGFGAWASLHPDRFDDYVAAFGTDRELALGGLFGWLSNDLPGYSNGSFLKMDVVPQGGGARPLLQAQEDEQPLARDQRDGISFDALLDLYALCGQDVRPHLLG